MNQFETCTKSKLFFIIRGAFNDPKARRIAKYVSGIKNPLKKQFAEAYVFAFITDQNGYKQTYERFSKVGLGMMAIQAVEHTLGEMFKQP